MTGCNIPGAPKSASLGGLTRDGAKEILGPRFNGRGKSIEFETGKIGSGCLYLYENGIENYLLKRGVLKRASSNSIAVSESGAKLIEVAGVSSGEIPTYALRCDAARLSVPIAKIKKLDITGISRDGAIAKVEFIAEWEPNGIGRMFEYDAIPQGELNVKEIYGFSRTEAGVFILRLYDDGWRIERRL